MHTPPRVGALPGSISALMLSTVLLASGGVLLACGGASKDGATGKEGEAETPAPAEAKVDDTKLADAQVDAKGPEEGQGEGKASADGAAASAEGGATPPPIADGPASGPPPPATGGPADGGGEGAADETAAAVDVDALLKEIKSKKTKDARIEAAVTEAEAAGVEPAALAKALVGRGEALYADPERARPLFELANEKDPKAPEAAFNLAKQAALVGDVEEAKKWLTVVHERKGKKLLKKIDFDPMWEIVKDDPDVRAMLK
jgi:hypothetical protein